MYFTYIVEILIYQKYIRFITYNKMRDVRPFFSTNVVHKFDCACLSQKNYRSLLLQKVRKPGYKISIVFIFISECIISACHICRRNILYYYEIILYIFVIVCWHINVFPIWIYKLFFIHMYEFRIAEWCR